MAAGKYTVLVTRHSDRIDRQAKVWQWMALAHEAGGRIEFLDEPGLVYREDDDMAETMAFLSGINNRKYSRQLKKNVTDAFAARKARGAFVGKVPWGFEVWCSVCGERSKGSDQCRQHDKMLRPAGDAKVTVPEMYRQSLAGDSLDKLSAAYGLPESTIRNILTLSVYAGRYEYADGTVHLCEALVSADTQEQVKKALTARQRRGQRGSKTIPALVIPVCYSCGGKAYRIRGGKPPWQRYSYYCSHCHKTADCQPVDFAILGVRWIDDKPEMESVWVEGDDYATQKAEIKRELVKLDPEDDDYLDRAMALRDALKAIPEAVKGHWDQRPTGRTLGQAFEALTDHEEQRAWLKAHRVEIDFTDGIVYVDGVGLSYKALQRRAVGTQNGA
jgi:hypothetical protein